MRTLGSRAHCRVAGRRGRPSALRSARSTTPASATTPALSSSGWACGGEADGLQVAEGVCARSRWPRRRFSSWAQPSSESTSATASNSTDGVPASWPSALSFLPPFERHAADLGRHDLDAGALAPRPALRTASTTAPSAPSVTRMPTARPSSVGGYLPMMRRAGDGSMSLRLDRRGGRRRQRRCSGRRRRAGPGPRRRCAGWPASRCADVLAAVTFDSSNTRALARWACSISVCER